MPWLGEGEEARTLLAAMQAPLVGVVAHPLPTCLIAT